MAEGTERMRRDRSDEGSERRGSRMMVDDPSNAVGVEIGKAIKGIPVGDCNVFLPC